jgi:hypothetical protein
MHTIVTIILTWIAIALGVAILFSIQLELTKIQRWKEQVKEKLFDNYGVRYETSQSLLDKYFPTRKVMYLTKIDPVFVANHLFWLQADKCQWMPSHFENRKLPDMLYYHDSWGGIIVEA